MSVNNIFVILQLIENFIILLVKEPYYFMCVFNVTKLQVSIPM